MDTRDQIAADLLASVEVLRPVAEHLLEYRLFPTDEEIAGIIGRPARSLSSGELRVLRIAHGLWIQSGHYDAITRLDAAGRFAVLEAIARACGMETMRVDDSPVVRLHLLGRL